MKTAEASDNPIGHSADLDEELSLIYIPEPTKPHYISAAVLLLHKQNK